MKRVITVQELALLKLLIKASNGYKQLKGEQNGFLQFVSLQ